MSAPCTICRKNQSVPEYRPFCSKRCADIDLGKWLTGTYVVPGEDAQPGESELDREDG